MRISDWSSDVCSSDLYYLHLLRRCGDGLVRPASLVAEASRQCVVRHDPEADLVGDEDELTLEPLNRLTKIARRGVDNGLRQHEVRSEEHTSELQSLMSISYAVFCLKKKNQYTN